MLNQTIRYFILCLSFFSLLSIPTFGQEIVDLEFKGGIGKLLIEINLAQLNVNREVENDVDVYKVRYTTKNLEGKIDTASGQLVIPQFRDKTMPLLVYQHGTVNDRNSVPSNFDITRQNESQIALIYGSFGYITLAPDYIGLGDSKGFHPYIHAESEAWAAIDMIKAVRSYALDNGIPINHQIFITGYSQGGHAAMAAHKVLQRDFKDELPVTASAPLSGPYNIYDSMVDFTLTDQEYDLVAYLAWVALSYQLVYPDFPSLDMFDQYFKPQYLDDILKFRNEEIGLFPLNDLLRNRLISETGKSIPKNMLQDSIVEAITTNRDHPISKALQDNDVYDWVPDVPMRMFYCMSDEQVYFKNSTFTDSIMNANGALDVSSMDLGSDLDHSGCVIPAITASLDFFNTLREVEWILSYDKVDISSLIKFYPNPVSDQLYLETKQDKIEELSIIGLSGSEVLKLKNPDSRIDLSSIAPGLYILNVKTKSETASVKLMVY